MHKKIILILILLFIPGVVFAERGTALEEKLIGSAFKSLAKAYVTVIDLNKLKEKNIARMEKMNEQKFTRRYEQIYKVIQTLPPRIKDTYGIRPQMSKIDVINNIKSLDKKKVYEIINALPDKTITGLFMDYLSASRAKKDSGNLNSQIKECWDNATQRAM